MVDWNNWTYLKQKIAMYNTETTDKKSPAKNVEGK